MRFGKIRTSGRTEKILTFKNHIMGQGYSTIIITNQRLGRLRATMSEGPNAFTPTLFFA